MPYSGLYWWVKNLAVGMVTKLEIADVNLCKNVKFQGILFWQFSADCQNEQNIQNPPKFPAIWYNII